MKIFIFSFITLLFIALIGLSIYLPDIIEAKATSSLKPYMNDKEPQVHFSFWSNTFKVEFDQDTIGLINTERYLYIDSGKLIVKRPSWLKLYQKGDISISEIIVEANKIEVVAKEVDESLSSKHKYPNININQFSVVSDSMDVDYQDYIIHSGPQSLVFNDIEYAEEKLVIKPAPSSIQNFMIGLPAGQEILTRYMTLEGDTLSLKDFELNDNTDIRKRVYFQSKIEKLSLVREDGFDSFETKTFDHLIVEGMNMQIDDDSDQPSCDGEIPCVKPIMAKYVFTLPINKSVKATGQLTYRFYANQKIHSLVELEKIYASAQYYYAEGEKERVQMNWDVRTTINEEIPVAFETRFFPSGKFYYQIQANNFPLKAMNPMIPPLENYVVELEEGQCTRLLVEVEGASRKSTAALSIDYNDLKLNIDDGKQKKWFTGILDVATPVFINNHHKTEEPIVHEVDFEEKRTFFYQIGQHVNHAVKETVLVF